MTTVSVSTFAHSILALELSRAALDAESEVLEQEQMRLWQAYHDSMVKYSQEQRVIAERRDAIDLTIRKLLAGATQVQS